MSDSPQSKTLEYKVIPHTSKTPLLALSVRFLSYEGDITISIDYSGPVKGWRVEEGDNAFPITRTEDPLELAEPLRNKKFGSGTGYNELIEEGYVLLNTDTGDRIYCGTDNALKYKGVREACANTFIKKWSKSPLITIPREHREEYLLEAK